MRRLSVLLMALGMTFIVVPAAQADNPLSDVAQGLEESSVYIALDIGNIPSDAASDLTGMLTENDQIVLVLLPEADATELGDPDEFAAELSNELGREVIVGLAVGDEAYGYSNTGLPDDVADGIMHRADNVSTNPVETLGTFVRSVHTWQREHPEEVAEAAPPTDDGMPVYGYVGLGVTGFILGWVLYWFFRRLKRQDTGEDRTRFNAPDQVAELLFQLATLRGRIEDKVFRDELYRCCLDIERYFNKYSVNKDRDAEVFRRHLQSIKRVVNFYLEVQTNPRDYDDPELDLNPRALMQKSQTSVEDFSEFVMNSIRRGNKANLIEFHVDTDILQAQRYR